jgi:hypothetical protein
MQTHLCRICLTADDSKLRELFSDTQDSSYADKVIFCSGIEVCLKFEDCFSIFVELLNENLL